MTDLDEKFAAWGDATGLIVCDLLNRLPPETLAKINGEIEAGTACLRLVATFAPSLCMEVVLDGPDGSLLIGRIGGDATPDLSKLN